MMRHIIRGTVIQGTDLVAFR